MRILVADHYQSSKHPEGIREVAFYPLGHRLSELFASQKVFKATLEGRTNHPALINSRGFKNQFPISYPWSHCPGAPSGNRLAALRGLGQVLRRFQKPIAFPGRDSSGCDDGGLGGAVYMVALFKTSRPLGPVRAPGSVGPPHAVALVENSDPSGLAMLFAQEPRPFKSNEQ